MSNFWSKRRAAVAAEEAGELAEARVAEVEAQAEEKTDAEICADLGLPDPDALEPGQDIAAFMRDVVPARIKRRALRKLWRLNPVLANLDGLNDYDGDFTDAALPGGPVSTTYMVGKGLAAHVNEMARQALARAEGPAPAPEPEPEPEDDIAEPEAGEVTLAEADPIAAPIAAADPEPDAPMPVSRRRMRFHFEDHATG